MPTKFDFDRSSPAAPAQKTDFYPPGTRAIQLYDSAVENYFLQAFGRNPRRIVCECERSAEPSIVQVLHLSNGATLNEKLKAPGQPGREAAQPPPRGDVRRRRWSTRSTWPAWPATRPRPSAAGSSRCCPPPGAADERTVVEDVFWGLLSSREFLFNH